MNSRTCTIPSKASGLGPAAAAIAVALIILGCGGGAPDPREADLIAARAVAALETQAGENGEGSISFHYTNKSTSANLTIDLGTTDLYMEMSGAPPKTPESEAAPVEKTAAPPRKAVQPRQEEQEDSRAGEEGQQRGAMRRPQPKTPEPKHGKDSEAGQEPSLPGEEPADYEDVTQRVLTGIRKAQELFYQKRYPEALQAVKSSLDARPTAEGHALAGSIHYMMNQGGMARRQWSEALRLNPDMPSVVNMLERTRTPGGRGSPSPRPILSRPSPRPAPAALPEADRPPFPEVYYEPAYNPPASGAPAAATAPSDPAASAAPRAQPPAPATAATAAPAPAETLRDGADTVHEAAAPATAPAPAPAAQPAPSPAAPVKTAPAKPSLPGSPKAKAAQEAKPK